MWLSKAIEGYWLTKKRDFSQATVRDYEHTFNRFMNFVGATYDVREITRSHVDGFLNHLKEEHKLSPKSVRNAWIALSSFWTWGEKELHLEHAIRGHVAAPKLAKKQIEAYTQAEVYAMLEACDHTSGAQRARRPTALRDRAIIVTLADTGVRVSELAAFTIGDYNQSRGQLMVKHGKGNKDRAVFLGIGGKKALWRYLAERPNAKEGEPLFATRNGTHMDRHAIRHMIQRAAKRAGIHGATVHRFRHTYAIEFLRNGGNVLELQYVLGHERMETLHIYVKLASVDLERAQRRASPADNWGL